MRRSLAQLLTLGLVALVSVSAAAIAAADPGILPRSTVDRADDSDGYQIKVLYVLPLDGVDRGLDTNGLAHAVIQNVHNWMLSETPGRSFRFDTYQGSLDIGFVRLTQTNAAIVSTGGTLGPVQAELRSAGYTHPRKLYLALFDGGAPGLKCGYGPYNSGGTVPIANLRSASPEGVPCALNRAGTPFGYFEFLVVHEVLHALGAVPASAPHQHDGGHSTDPADVMCSGTCGPQLQRRLDPGRDDYYGHGQADRIDVARSAFLEPAFGAELPLNWLHGERPTAGCELEGNLRSTGGAPARLELVNGTTRDLRMYWIDYTGQRRLYAVIPPLRSFVSATFVSHPWVVADIGERCLRVVLPAEPTGLYIVRDDLVAPQSVAAATSGTTVRLTWNPAPGASHYVVEASTTPGGAAIAAQPVHEPVLVATNVPHGTYYVRVRAVGVGGQSAVSSEVTVTVPGVPPGGQTCSTPPLPPQLDGSVIAATVTLTWRPSSTGCPAGRFVVHAGSRPGASDLAQLDVGTQVRLQAQAPPGTYYVRVVAMNAAGASPPSQEIVVTISP